MSILSLLNRNPNATLLQAYRYSIATQLQDYRYCMVSPSLLYRKPTATRS